MRLKLESIVTMVQFGTPKVSFPDAPERYPLRLGSSGYSEDNAGMFRHDGTSNLSDTGLLAQMFIGLEHGLFGTRVDKLRGLSDKTLPFHDRTAVISGGFYRSGRTCAPVQSAPEWFVLVAAVAGTLCFDSQNQLLKTA